MKQTRKKQIKMEINSPVINNTDFYQQTTQQSVTPFDPQSNSNLNWYSNRQSIVIRDGSEPSVQLTSRHKPTNPDLQVIKIHRLKKEQEKLLSQRSLASSHSIMAPHSRNFANNTQVDQPQFIQTMKEIQKLKNDNTLFRGARTQVVSPQHSNFASPIPSDHQSHNQHSFSIEIVKKKTRPNSNYNSRPQSGNMRRKLKFKNSLTRAGSANHVGFRIKEGTSSSRLIEPYDDGSLERLERFQRPGTGRLTSRSYNYGSKKVVGPKRNNFLKQSISTNNKSSKFIDKKILELQKAYNKQKMIQNLEGDELSDQLIMSTSSIQLDRASMVLNRLRQKEQALDQLIKKSEALKIDGLLDKLSKNLETNPNAKASFVNSFLNLIQTAYSNSQNSEPSTEHRKTPSQDIEPQLMALPAIIAEESNPVSNNTSTDIKVVKQDFEPERLQVQGENPQIQETPIPKTSSGSRIQQEPSDLTEPIEIVDSQDPRPQVEISISKVEEPKKKVEESESNVDIVTPTQLINDAPTTFHFTKTAQFNREISMRASEDQESTGRSFRPKESKESNFQPSEKQEEKLIEQITSQLKQLRKMKGGQSKSEALENQLKLITERDFEKTEEEQDHKEEFTPKILNKDLTMRNLNNHESEPNPDALVKHGSLVSPRNLMINQEQRNHQERHNRQSTIKQIKSIPQLQQQVSRIEESEADNSEDTEKILNMKVPKNPNVEEFIKKGEQLPSFINPPKRVGISLQDEESGFDFSEVNQSDINFSNLYKFHRQRTGKPQVKKVSLKENNIVKRMSQVVNLQIINKINSEQPGLSSPQKESSKDPRAPKSQLVSSHSSFQSESIDLPPSSQKKISYDPIDVQQEATQKARTPAKPEKLDLNISEHEMHDKQSQLTQTNDRLSPMERTKNQLKTQKTNMEQLKKNDNSIGYIIQKSDPSVNVEIDLKDIEPEQSPKHCKPATFTQALEAQPQFGVVQDSFELWDVPVLANRESPSKIVEISIENPVKPQREQSERSSSDKNMNFSKISASTNLGNTLKFQESIRKKMGQKVLTIMKAKNESMRGKGVASEPYLVHLQATDPSKRSPNDLQEIPQDSEEFEERGSVIISQQSEVKLSVSFEKQPSYPQEQLKQSPEQSKSESKSSKPSEQVGSDIEDPAISSKSCLKNIQGVLLNYSAYYSSQKKLRFREKSSLDLEGMSSRMGLEVQDDRLRAVKKFETNLLERTSKWRPLCASFENELRISNYLRFAEKSSQERASISFEKDRQLEKLLQEIEQHMTGTDHSLRKIRTPKVLVSHPRHRPLLTSKDLNPKRISSGQSNFNQFFSFTGKQAKNEEQTNAQFLRQETILTTQNLIRQLDVRDQSFFDMENIKKLRKNISNLREDYKFVNFEILERHHAATIKSLFSAKQHRLEIKHVLQEIFYNREMQNYDRFMRYIDLKFASKLNLNFFTNSIDYESLKLLKSEEDYVQEAMAMCMELKINENIDWTLSFKQQKNWNEKRKRDIWANYWILSVSRAYEEASHILSVKKLGHTEYLQIPKSVITGILFLHDKTTRQMPLLFKYKLSACFKEMILYLNGIQSTTYTKTSRFFAFKTRFQKVVKTSEMCESKIDEKNLVTPVQAYPVFKKVHRFDIFKLQSLLFQMENQGFIYSLRVPEWDINYWQQLNSIDRISKKIQKEKLMDTSADNSEDSASVNVSNQDNDEERSFLIVPSKQESKFSSEKAVVGTSNIMQEISSSKESFKSVPFKQIFPSSSDNEYDGAYVRLGAIDRYNINYVDHQIVMHMNKRLTRVKDQMSLNYKYIVRMNEFCSEYQKNFGYKSCNIKEYSLPGQTMEVYLPILIHKQEQKLKVYAQNKARRLVQERNFREDQSMISISPTQDSLNPYSLDEETRNKLPGYKIESKVSNILEEIYPSDFKTDESMQDITLHDINSEANDGETSEEDSKEFESSCNSSVSGPEMDSIELQELQMRVQMSQQTQDQDDEKKNNQTKLKNLEGLKKFYEKTYEHPLNHYRKTLVMRTQNSASLCNFISQMNQDYYINSDLYDQTKNEAIGMQIQEQKRGVQVEEAVRSIQQDLQRDQKKQIQALGDEVEYKKNLLENHIRQFGGWMGKLTSTPAGKIIQKDLLKSEAHLQQMIARNQINFKNLDQQFQGDSEGSDKSSKFGCKEITELEVTKFKNILKDRQPQRSSIIQKSLSLKEYLKAKTDLNLQSSVQKEIMVQQIEESFYQSESSSISGSSKSKSTSRRKRFSSFEDLRKTRNKSEQAKTSMTENSPRGRINLINNDPGKEISGHIFLKPSSENLSFQNYHFGRACVVEQDSQNSGRLAPIDDSLSSSSEQLSEDTEKRKIQFKLGLHNVLENKQVDDKGKIMMKKYVEQARSNIEQYRLSSVRQASINPHHLSHLLSMISKHSSERKIEQGSLYLKQEFIKELMDIEDSIKRQKEKENFIKDQLRESLYKVPRQMNFKQKMQKQQNLLKSILKEQKSSRNRIIQDLQMERYNLKYNSLENRVVRHIKKNTEQIRLIKQEQVKLCKQNLELFNTNDNLSELQVVLNPWTEFVSFKTIMMLTQEDRPANSRRRSSTPAPRRISSLKIKPVRHLSKANLLEQVRSQQPQLAKLSDREQFQIYQKMLMCMDQGDVSKLNDFLQQLQQTGQEFLNITNDFGNSMVACATVLGCPQMIKSLLDFGFDPNHQNFIGDTALHYAMEAKRNDCINVLINNGADEYLQNLFGLTPWEVYY